MYKFICQGLDWGVLLVRSFRRFSNPVKEEKKTVKKKFTFSKTHTSRIKKK